MRPQTIASVVIAISALLSFCGGMEEPPYKLGDPPKKGFIALIQNGFEQQDIIEQHETSESAAHVRTTLIDGNNVPVGHLRLREIVRRIVPQRHLSGASFTSEGATDLRTYAAHSQVSPIDFSKGKASSIESFFFCNDGTFSYRVTLGGDENPSPPQFSRGVWDSVRDGLNKALVMYSNDPSFAPLSIQESGLMIFPIARSEEDILQLGYYGGQSGLNTLFMKSSIDDCP